MEQAIKVSVILPVYNVEKFLKQCLESILNQTLREIEVICVDDGSQDSSLQILHDYEKKDSRIIVIQQTNGGAGAARNTGLKVAKGEYLSFLDSDDFFEKDMLEKAYQKCKNNDLDFVVFRCNSYDNQKAVYNAADWTIRRYLLPKKEIFSHEDISKDIFRLFNGWAWDKLYKRSFIEQHSLKFQEIRTTNDAFFVFSALIKAKRISIIDEILVHQRININTSLSRTREKSWDCCNQAIMALKTEFVQTNMYDAIEQSFINWVLNFVLWNVNTLQGEAREKLILAVNDNCFKELSFEKYPKEYFYNQDEYRQYIEIFKNNSVARENYLRKTINYCKENGIRATIKKIRNTIIK